jgi:hypothetical protein
LYSSLNLLAHDAAAAHKFFAKSEAEKRKRFLGFHQQKFVGFSHAERSLRQFIQLARHRVSFLQAHVPSGAHAQDAPLSGAYSSLLDTPCESLESFNECVSVHSDMGLLTVSPHSNLPRLMVLKHSDATW